MDQIIEKFWDEVAPKYSSNKMTTEHADTEIITIIESIKMLDIKTIFSIGCTDASRDPTFILNNPKIKIDPNCVVYYNDISKKMIKIATDRLKKYSNIILKPLVGPIQNYLDQPKYNSLKNQTVCIGVYDVKYFKKAIELYIDEKDIIGTKFKLVPIILINNIFQEHQTEKIIFNHDSWNSDDSWHKILLWQTLNNFVSIKVETDTGFISNYYSKLSLVNIMNSIVINNNYSIKYDLSSPDDRHTILILKPTHHKSTGVVTMINNVMGNIVTESQYDIFKKLVKYASD